MSSKLITKNSFMQCSARCEKGWGRPEYSLNFMGKT